MDKYDVDNLPMPDDETLAIWRAEAVAEQPQPQDWADLAVMLRWAAELERRGASNPSLPDRMTAAELSLRAILIFIQGQRHLMDYGALGPLLRLHGAIVDLADNRISPMFKPTRRKAGRPGTGQTDAFVMGFAARALSELIQGGVKPLSAARQVAGALRTTDGFKNIDAKTVTNWRERIMQGPGPGAPYTAIEHYTADLPGDLGNTPKQRGENLLALLKKRASNIG